MGNLPYRRNVGAIIFNQKGLLFVALRHDLAKEDIWSFPQGGIDEEESPELAIKRELKEEIGTDQVTVLEEYPQWLTYDLPEHLIGKALQGKYRGQTQKWFAVRFLGEDHNLRLNTQTHQEFDQWKWVSISELSELNTGFKRDLYLKLAHYFKKYTSN